MFSTTTHGEHAAEPLRRSKWHAVRLRAAKAGDWTRATPDPLPRTRAVLLAARIRTGHGRWAPRGAWTAEARTLDDVERTWGVWIAPARQP